MLPRGDSLTLPVSLPVETDRADRPDGAADPPVDWAVYTAGVSHREGSGCAASPPHPARALLLCRELVHFPLTVKDVTFLYIKVCGRLGLASALGAPLLYL